MDFGVRDGRPYAFYSKATVVATGGACGLYRWLTKPWYPPSNAGGGLAMGIRAGAEMTSFEARFVPIRIKDISAPIGVAAVGFKGTVRNVLGQAFMAERYAHLGGEGAPISVRVYAPTEEIMRGRGPCVIDMRGIPEEAERELEEMYLHGRPSFLLFLRANGIKLSEQPLEIAGLEPYITGSHSLAGYWVDERRRTTLPGLFAAGDCAGGMSLKHAGGALAEGEIAGQSAAEEAREVKRPPKRALRAEARRLLSRAMAPLGRE
ncbi:MAG TPA: FAD-binding protein, partial [Chromatiaceae bacterium]|nr:FAD-binding protein [Chromatiaceae bacterium]